MIEERRISTSTVVLESGQDIAQLAWANEQNQQKRNERIKTALINLGLFVGSGIALAGNVLLLNYDIIKPLPAACLIADLTVANAVSLGWTMLKLCNIESEVANKILVWGALAGAPFLPKAVIELNPWPLDEKLLKVSIPFMLATGLVETANVTIAAEEVAKLCDNSEQREVSTFRKISRNVSSAVMPIALGLITAGMLNMFQDELAAEENEEKINEIKKAFITAIAGMGTVFGAFTIKTVLDFKKYFSSRNSSSVTIEEVEDEDILVENDQLEQVVTSDETTSESTPEPVLNPEAGHQLEADEAQGF